jgi:HEPN domain-containing protein
MAQRKEKKIEPDAIFLEAVKFHTASRTLQEWKPWHPSGVRAMDMPFAILNAFSSELFLKALICIETGHIPRGHHLLSLFNALSAKTRKRITEMWDAYAITHADRWPEIEAIIGSPVARDLPTALRLGSKTFELARYYYEGREEFQFYIGALPYMLGRVAFELKPDWSKHAAQTFDSMMSERPAISVFSASLAAGQAPW